MEPGLHPLSEVYPELVGTIGSSFVVTHIHLNPLTETGAIDIKDIESMDPFTEMFLTAECEGDQIILDGILYSVLMSRYLIGLVDKEGEHENINGMNGRQAKDFILERT